MIRDQRQLRMRALGRMFHAAKASTSFFYDACLRDPTLAGDDEFGVRDIRDCREDMENTYLTRMFSEFEITLRDYWANACRRKTYPPARDLIDAIASRRAVIWDVLAKVHQIREYRNAIIHGGAVAPRIQLVESQTCLSKFISRLPWQW